MSRIGTVRAGEHLVDGLRVAGGVAPGQSAHLGVRDPDVERIDVVDADLTSLELVDGGRGGDGELVEAVVTEEHERPLDAEGGEGADHPFGHDRVGHADGAAGGARRVGERPEEVEGGGRAQLAPHRRREAHRRVEPLGEAEADADFAHAARHTVGPEVDHHAERLEHVDRTALRRRGAAAVLGDASTGRRGDDRGHGGHVHRAGTVTAGAAGVDQRRLDVGEVDVVGELEHRAHEGGELPGGLALGAQPDREGRDLGVGRVTREDDRHRVRDQLVGQVLAPEQTPDDVGPQRWIHPPDTTGDDHGERRTKRRVRRGFRPGSGGLAALADESAAFPLVETAPHTLLLAVHDRVLEAGFPHGADRADRLGLARPVVRLGRRVEELRIGAQTAGVLAPVIGHRSRAFWTPPRREGRWISSNTVNFGCSSPVPESSFGVRVSVDRRPTAGSTARNRVGCGSRSPETRPVAWDG